MPKEQQKDVGNQLPNIFEKIVIKFSGADGNIIERLTRPDRTPYLIIGILLYSVPAGLCSIALVFAIVNLNFSLVILAFGWTTFASAIIFFLFRYMLKVVFDKSFLGFFNLLLPYALILIATAIVKRSLENEIFFGLNYYISWNSMVLNILTYYPFIIVFLCLIILYASRDDFYHQLLAKQKEANTVLIDAKRKEIERVFENQLELDLTKKVLDDIGSLNSDSSITELAIKLGSASDPKSLSVLADIQLKTANYNKALIYINRAIELNDDQHKSIAGANLDPELFETKSAILKALRLFEDAENCEKTAIKIRNENAFNNNKGKKFILDKVMLENVSVFDDFTWTLKPGINVLLGKNGYGKSHLLGLLIALIYEDKTKIKEWINTSAMSKACLYMIGDVPADKHEEELKAKSAAVSQAQRDMEKKVTSYQKNLEESASNEEIRIQFSAEIEYLTRMNNEVIQMERSLNRATVTADVNTIVSKTGRVPVLAIPDTRFINKAENLIDNNAGEYADPAQFGAYEFLYLLPYAVVIKNALFSASLNYFANKNNFDAEPFGLIKRVIKSLSADKLVIKEGKAMYQDESNFAFKEIQRSDKEGGFRINVMPEDSNVILPIQRVSQGTFSIIAICCIIYNYLRAVYGDREDILEQQAIVIIDELDAHIHPSWQQKLISLLRENFPSIQFIITAHSPLLIEGCKSGEVSVMRRTETGKFSLETITRSLIGASREEIFSQVFEIENRNLTLLRYQELAKYKDDFAKELGALTRLNQDQLKGEQIMRINELKEFMLHVDSASRLYEEKKDQTLKDFQEIMDMQDKAAKNSLDTPNVSIPNP